MNITVNGIIESFSSSGYVCDEDIAVPVYLALTLGRPLLVEGEPGVGKTEIGKVLAQVFGCELIRLQCYEGLDETKALYEWNYQRQLLRIQMRDEAVEDDLFSEQYLLERPLLKALRSDQRPVLLIDEIDKCDEEFEAFLFEVLSDFQVSVPELGTIKAQYVPIVVLTSNRARELSDGLKRRCLYLYIDFPSVERELKIIQTKVPEVEDRLALQIAKVMNSLRDLELEKKPSISETLDWARSLVALGAKELSPGLMRTTASVLVKNRSDLEMLTDPQVCTKALRSGESSE